MTKFFTGPIVLAAALAGSGCVLTEAVTPPPPRIGGLPAEAQAIFAQAVPQCEDPAKTGIAFPQQAAEIQAEKARLQMLIDKEKTRWNNRRYYLERELRFYEREVRRTGGSFQYTSAANRGSFLKVASDSAFTDQIKRQREREYNERQHRRFFRELNEGRAKHQERMGLYLARFDELENSLAACGELQVTLRKAKEEQELRKNTVAMPHLVPDIRARTVPADALPQEEAPENQTVETAPLVAEQAPPTGEEAMAVEQAPVESVQTNPIPVPPVRLPETMEELLSHPFPATATTTPSANPANTAPLLPEPQPPAANAEQAPKGTIEDLFDMPASQQANRQVMP